MAVNPGLAVGKTLDLDNSGSHMETIVFLLVFRSVPYECFCAENNKDFYNTINSFVIILHRTMIHIFFINQWH